MPGQWPNLDAVRLFRSADGDGASGLPVNTLSQDNPGVGRSQAANHEQQGSQRTRPPPLSQGLGSQRTVRNATPEIAPLAALARRLCYERQQNSTQQQFPQVL